MLNRMITRIMAIEAITIAARAPVANRLTSPAEAGAAPPTVEYDLVDESDPVISLVFGGAEVGELGELVGVPPETVVVGAGNCHGPRRELEDDVSPPGVSELEVADVVDVSTKGQELVAVSVWVSVGVGSGVSVVGFGCSVSMESVGVDGSDSSLSVAAGEGWGESPVISGGGPPPEPSSPDAEGSTGAVTTTVSNTVSKTGT